MFNKIYSKFTDNNNKIPKHIIKCSETFETNLDSIVNSLYQEEEKENISKDKPTSTYLNNILNFQIENMNKIQNDLLKMLKENFKYKDLIYSNDISRRNSEPVLLEKDEIIDVNRFSQLVDLNCEDYDEQKKIDIINENVSRINLLIKKLWDISKPPDNSSKI